MQHENVPRGEQQKEKIELEQPLLDVDFNRTISSDSQAKKVRSKIELITMRRQCGVVMIKRVK